jgi:hypothetical protein
MIMCSELERTGQVAVTAYFRVHCSPVIAPSVIPKVFLVPMPLNEILRKNMDAVVANLALQEAFPLK